MSRLSVCLAAILMLLATHVSAENFDVYPFASPEEELRFERLTHELRCPKCQNQSLADSNAPIAQDLRKRTYELVREGRSDDEIVVYLKARYGEFITYRPSFNLLTAFLWAGPFLLLLTAVVVLLLVRRRRMSSGAGIADTSSATPAGDEVRAILARYQEPDTAASKTSGEK